MRLLACAISFLVLMEAMADNVNTQLDTLISRGNRAYELSQPSSIKLYADSIASILDSESLDEDAHKDYSVSLLKLRGNYHYEKANLDSAEYYYLKAQKIINESPNTDFHGNVLLLPREFAQLYYRQGRYAEAEAVMLPVYEDIEYNNRYDSEINPGERLNFMMAYAMCLARLKRFEEAIEIANEELKNCIEKESLDYAKAQRMYAKIQLLANADRQGALTAYKNYFINQKRFARLNFAKMTSSQREEYWQTLRPFVADCYLLEDSDPGFLYNIALFSKGLLLQLTKISGAGKASESALRTLDYNWQDIQKKLKAGEAAIEFIQYGDDGDQRMAALLLKPVGKPKFIPLTNPNEIISLCGKSISSISRNDKDRLYSQSELQNKIWTAPLLEALKGVNLLYFAPDGYMHRLAVEYMPKVENIDLCRLSSTRILMDTHAPLSSKSPLLAFGAIDYNHDTNADVKTGNDPKAYRYYLGKSFTLLDANSNETVAIAEDRTNRKDSILSGAYASELAFRTLAPQYESIILSTHGDFCATQPVATDLKPVFSEETMSQNVIAFSGVNSHLRNNSFDADNYCDGLISAKELATLNLSKCKLFTASACQTALGEITSDGVFGMQRGLKNAGVDAMLLSLWNVESDATSILMKEFYHNINTGMPIRKAFKEARKKLLAGIPVETIDYEFNPASMTSEPVTTVIETYNTPQFTNAFILIDAL